MPISWNEIRHNALAFSREWATETREEAEAKSFWDEFFKVFGIKRRTIASFEEPVKKLTGSWGYIDLFWKGMLLAEHKSRGKPLDKAHTQAMEYIQGLKTAHRDAEIPRYVIVSDFAIIALHDLEEGTSLHIPLANLHEHVDKFGFIPGYKQHKLDEQDPINIKAVERLGELRDALGDGGYTGHDLERFLVRILFCMFAEDTALFERDAFTLFIENHTQADGSDLGGQLARLFQVLNTPIENRQRNLLEELASLPYVNGELFAEALGFADFNRTMRDKLLLCCRFDWSRISPAIFGSLFQSVMEPRERRRIGAHYTSERDILKLMRSLFLDDLRAEFDRLKSNKGTQREARLNDFHVKLGTLTFFDPACGCGNFLVVTYRELRRLETELLLELRKKGNQQLFLTIEELSNVNVDAMYGIEINEFPALIAQVALWLVDHQMNQELSKAFGQYFARLPLKRSATIVHANALRIDWRTVLPAERCAYLLGNPPFIGAKYQGVEQRSDMAVIAGNVKSFGLLDYVTAWYFKASEYITGTGIGVGFVSTNSITQGEQVGVLWGELFRQGVRIHFGHRTFAWESEARGKAHVHVVIIGFGMGEAASKRIYDYEQDPSSPSLSTAKNISPYLVDGPDTVVLNRSKPLCKVPKLSFGSMPNDDGCLLFSSLEKAQFLQLEPNAAKFFRPILGSVEFINSIERWCLWLNDATPSELRAMPKILERIELVKEWRLRSKRPATHKLAVKPAIFGEIRQPSKRYLGIPKSSLKARRFIPIGFLEPETIANSELFTAPDASSFHFGILSSTMHMAWVRQVCGRIKSDYRYSVKLVYNNFPWPESPTDKQRDAVEAKAQVVLDARSKFPESSLADLYDPLTMPPTLTKAHAELDKAVDLCYRKAAFGNDRKRVEFLFQLYEKLTAPLTVKIKNKK